MTADVSSVPAADRARPARRAAMPMAIAVLATLLLALCTFLTTRVAMPHIVTCNEQQLRVRDLTSDVRYLDEVLTMAANMAAATGEARWQQRYDAHVGRLDEAIAALRAISPTVFDRELGADTDAANRRLVAMETKVFELVAAGDKAAARAVLDGREYAADKVIYAHGNQRAQQALAELTIADSEDARWWSLLTLQLTLGLTVVASAAWVLMSRRAREARTATELTLAQARSSAAEAATRAKSQFVANISHELRTPMTAILGYAELLADRSYPENQRSEACSTIVRNGQHLLQVVNDLLDMSKIEAGAVGVDVAPTDPALVVEDVVSLMRVRAGAKGLVVERQFATTMPRRITTDALRLRQILVNLVGNAIKFTERGSVRIVVRHDTVAGRIEFAVEDTGIGMNAEQIARLFRAFSQVDESAERRFGGTGLGLALSKRYAELLGGALDVRSQPGAGSVFTLRLPAGAAADVWHPDVAEIADVRAERAAAMPSGTTLAGKRILLAEDGRDNQRLVSWHLTRAGAEVVLADNGRQALEAMAGGRFDLVLMDIQMPEIDGYRATTLLRERGHTVPIVALTANAMATDRERCLRAGCTDYLTKPIDRARLVATCIRLANGAEQAAAAAPSAAETPVG